MNSFWEGKRGTWLTNTNKIDSGSSGGVERQAIASKKEVATPFGLAMTVRIIISSVMV
jgi:hypothetical protein